MKIEIVLIILAIEIVAILSLNKYLLDSRNRNYLLLITIVLFIVGLSIKNENNFIDYRLFLIPFIQVLLVGLTHFIFQFVFKTDFNLNIRGFEFPNKLKSETSGFLEFMSLVFSIGIILLTLIIFFLL